MTKQADDKPVGNGPELVSKSQRKREAKAHQDLARTLMELPLSQYRALPLSEELRHAVDHGRGISAHVARKRQMLFIGKLLRRTDVEPITQALEGPQQAARELTARQHRVETWRDQLLGEQGASALSDLLDHCHRTGLDVEVQSLRQCIRTAARERQAGKPPAAARRLFKTLRALDERQALPPIGLDDEAF